MAAAAVAAHQAGREIAPSSVGWRSALAHDGPEEGAAACSCAHAPLHARAPLSTSQASAALAAAAAIRPPPQARLPPATELLPPCSSSRWHRSSRQRRQRQQRRGGDCSSTGGERAGAGSDHGYAPASGAGGSAVEDKRIWSIGTRTRAAPSCSGDSTHPDTAEWHSTSTLESSHEPFCQMPCPVAVYCRKSCNEDEIRDGGGQ